MVVNNQEFRKIQVVSWLTSSSGAGVGESIAIRRASVVALSVSKNDLEAIFEKSLQQFGDQLYIRHTPIMQQEGIYSWLLYGSMLTPGFSPHASFAFICWLCQPHGTITPENDNEVRGSSERHF